MPFWSDEKKDSHPPYIIKLLLLPVVTHMAVTPLINSNKYRFIS